jgi:hypothetical protein
VSIVALDLFMSGEVAALAAYLHGDRELPVIVAAFDRHDVPLPKRNVAAMATYHPGGKRFADERLRPAPWIVPR